MHAAAGKLCGKAEITEVNNKDGKTCSYKVGDKATGKISVAKHNHKNCSRAKNEAVKILENGGAGCVAKHDNQNCWSCG